MLISRFALTQLAPLPPFDRWQALAPHRMGYGVGGISAFVLAEKSAGQADDIRRIEALLRPPDPDATAPRVMAEGFRADTAELETPRRTAIGILGGKGRIDSEAASWSATGVVTSGGLVRSVIIEPKLRAILEQPEITNILSLRQKGSNCRTLARLADSSRAKCHQRPSIAPATARAHLGFAAEPAHVRIWRCLHVAQAVMALGNLGSRWPAALSVLAVTVILVMLCAVSDLRAILHPPPRRWWWHPALPRRSTFG